MHDATFVRSSQFSSNCQNKSTSKYLWKSSETLNLIYDSQYKITQDNTSDEMSSICDINCDIICQFTFTSLIMQTKNIVQILHHSWWGVFKSVRRDIWSCHFKPIFRDLNTIAHDTLSPLFLHQWLTTFSYPSNEFSVWPFPFETWYCF